MEKSDKDLRSVKQDQIHGLLFNREIGWQDIIYDLINTEQLDPWDINISLLADKYIEKVQELEETDFVISGKVLFAASFLLRIKSEFLLNKHLKSIDEILFEKKDTRKTVLERIELDEEIPELFLRTPLPRLKKVTLKELMDSLGRAINTENKRINKHILHRNILREHSFSIPKKTFKIKDKIREIYDNLSKYFNSYEAKEKISFTDFAGKNEEKILSFSPLLHLEHQKKVWLEQQNHFEEIYIWLEKTYSERNPDRFADLKRDLEEEIERKEINERTKGKEEIRKLDKEKRKRLKNIEKEFSNPIGELV